MSNVSDPLTITFVTGNAGKLREVKAILEPAGINVDSRAVDLDEIQSPVPETVTLDKCRRAADTVSSLSRYQPVFEKILYF